MSWEHFETLWQGPVCVVVKETGIALSATCHYERITTGKSRSFHGERLTLRADEFELVHALKGTQPDPLALLRAFAQELDAAGFIVLVAGTAPGYRESGLSAGTGYGYVERGLPAQYFLNYYDWREESSLKKGSARKVGF